MLGAAPTGKSPSLAGPELPTRVRTRVSRRRCWSTTLRCRGPDAARHPAAPTVALTVGELVGEGRGGQRTDEGHHRDAGDADRIGEGLQVAGGRQGLLGAICGDDDLHQWSPSLLEGVAEPEAPGDPDLSPKAFSAM
jgi:hypothetical protein